MLIVLTSERLLDQETKHLNHLFSEGLELLHLRKPGFTEGDYRQYLSRIEPLYYPRIMIHHEHPLCVEYGLRGVHLQEQPRRDLEKKLEGYVASYSQKGFKVSSSFHAIEELETYAHHFEYVFLSPVFSSISKAGYEGKGFDVSSIEKKVIGMGGIKVDTVDKAQQLGFAGVGVLGGIWNSPDYLQSFLDIKRKVEEVYA